MLRNFAAGLAAALCFAMPAAQAAEGDNDPKIVKAAEGLAGVYIFDVKGGGNGLCLMKLEASGSYNQFEAWLSGGCESSFGFLSVLSGWEPIGTKGIKLIGAEGSTMGEFKPAGGGYEAVVENDGQTYTLTRPTP